MLFTRIYQGSRTFESAYRVDEFRRLLPKVGVGRGLVQFWGGAKRRIRDDDSGTWSDWVRSPHTPETDLRTVEINDIVKITDQKR